MKPTFYLLIALVMLGSSCASSHKLTKPAIAMQDKLWVLTQMEGYNNKAPKEELFTLGFNPADSTVFGSGACNRFFGKYLISRAKIDLRLRGATRMSCPDMDKERNFILILGDADEYIVDEEYLILLQGKKVLATFIPFRK